jgi:hypothetical protein
MRPSTRTAALSAALLVPLLAAGAEAAPVKAKGNGPSSAVSTYTGVGRTVECAPLADSCVADGTANASTGALTATTSISRTKPTAASDQVSALPWIAKGFDLPAGKHSITALVHFSKVTQDPRDAASSPDGYAQGHNWLGVEIQEHKCPTDDCGVGPVRTDVVTDVKDSLLGRSTGQSPENGAADQTLTVVLSMPDGSALPAGRITVYGFVAAGGTSAPLSCPGDTTCPPASTAHTGSTFMGISATITSIGWTIA